MSAERGAVTLLRPAMETLASKRPIFHSEADFQHALAWEVQLAHPDAEIRLERRVAVRPNIQLDLLLSLEGARFGVELKYLRRGMTAEVGGETFTLSTGADDHGRYSAIEDVARLERLIVDDVIDSGALVLLTNVANVWEPPASRRRVLYEDFRFHDGHVLSGEMKWGSWGAKGGRPPGGTVTLKGVYSLSWSDYSVVGGIPFRYVLVSVE